MNLDRALARHHKAEEKTMKALYKSADAMSELYKTACYAQISGVKGADDERITLAATMREFAGFLEGHVNYRKALDKT